MFALGARTEACRDASLRAQQRGAAKPREAGLERGGRAPAEPGSGDARWIPDGRANAVRFGGPPARRADRRRIGQGRPERGAAGPAGRVDAGAGRRFRPVARQLAGAIVDWRDADDLLTAEGGAEDPQYATAEAALRRQGPPFETRRPNCARCWAWTPALYREARSPHLTVYSGLARPNPAFAAMPVLQAMGLGRSGGRDRWPSAARRNPAAGPGDPGASGIARRAGQRNV